MHHFFPMLRQLKASIEAASQWQMGILKVMSLLPGAHPYEEVERAIRVSGVHPRYLYECLAANRTTFIVQRFYELLSDAKLK